jgi:hypothetical protein
MQNRNEIETKRFTLEQSSYQMLKAWMNAYALDLNDLDTLPKLGLGVWYQGKCVGVAFIREVEGYKGLIDGFICDPDLLGEDRSKCLDLLILDLLKLARAHRMTGLIGLSVNKRVMSRALRLGFDVRPHKVVSITF